MKYYIIAGEASGDLHGAGLITELRKLDSHAEFIGMGGDKMQNAGCRLIQNYRNMAFMAVVAVVKNIGKIKDNFVLAKKSIEQFQPDHLILIDYPSFNLRVAKYVKKRFPQIKISYYIPPKVWAWKKWRVHKIAKYSDHILGIFPFEPEFYAKYGYKAEYVGNPTMDSIDSYLAKNSSSNRNKQIALVPGSRKSEVANCLPIMLRAAYKYADNYKIIVTMAPTLDDDFYTRIINQELGTNSNLITLTRETYCAVNNSIVAVVNSGTATLETALLNTPQVAVYHLAFPHLIAAIRNILFTIPYFTLVNIVAGKEVIHELLAYEFTESNVQIYLEKLLNDKSYVDSQLEGYAVVRETLGHHSAAQMAANRIVND